MGSLLEKNNGLHVLLILYVFISIDYVTLLILFFHFPIRLYEVTRFSLEMGVLTAAWAQVYVINPESRPNEMQRSSYRVDSTS